MPLNPSLTPGQLTVLSALNDFGQPVDDQGLAVYVHHVASNGMSSSGVRTRRVELERKGFVTQTGSKTTKSGKQAAIHTITQTGKRALAGRV